MRWFIFKAPHIKGDKPLEIHNSEIGLTLFELKAMRFGPIIMISEEELKNNGEIV